MERVRVVGFEEAGGGAWPDRAGRARTTPGAHVHLYLGGAIADA